MAPEKETIMALKVDLQCDRCYQKVKRVLCKFPQIRDQVYDEKQNTVMIKVVCCSPEKIRGKLCVKGGKSIKSIQILQPKSPAKPTPAKKPPLATDSAPPPPPPPNQTTPAAPPVKQHPPAPDHHTPPPPTPTPVKQQQPPTENPPAEKPKEKPPAALAPAKIHKNGSARKPKPDQQQTKPPETPPPKQDTNLIKPDAKQTDNSAPTPTQSIPSPPPPQTSQVPMGNPLPPPGIYPVNTPCYEGGLMYPPPVPPQPAVPHVTFTDPYGYYGLSGWDHNRPPGYCITRRCDCFSEDNPQACVIM